MEPAGGFTLGCRLGAPLGGLAAGWPVAVLTRGLALGCLGLGSQPSDRVRTFDERSSASGTSRL